MKYPHLIETVSRPRPKAWIIGKTLAEIENKKTKRDESAPINRKAIK